MLGKRKSIKIGKVEIKDHRNVSFTMAFIIALAAFAAGVLAYHLFFKVLPQKPGCVQVTARTTDGITVQGAAVAIIYTASGEQVASALTDKNGRAVICGSLLPNEDYTALILKEDLSAIINFRTNEKSTAEFPVIVKTTTP